MQFVLAILIPPLAVWHHGTPRQTALSTLLTLLLWVPGAIYAVHVVSLRVALERKRRHPQLGRPNPWGMTTR